MSMQVRPTESAIREIVEIAVDAPIDNFTMSGNWYEDYAMDSLGAIALVVEVQKVYGVRLPDERMPNIRTGDQLVEAILELQAAAAGAAEGQPGSGALAQAAA